jgi:hypothetical protein
VAIVYTMYPPTLQCLYMPYVPGPVLVGAIVSISIVRFLFVAPRTMPPSFYISTTENVPSGGLGRRSTGSFVQDHLFPFSSTLVISIPIHLRREYFSKALQTMIPRDPMKHFVFEKH